jgi:excisionase family DNA binding protein
MPLNQKLLFDIPSAAGLLSLSQGKVVRLIERGDLKAGWLGGRLLVSRSSLLKLAASVAE